MIDRKKVIKGLETCTSRPYYCMDCPYKANCYFGSQEVMEDALTLLKEQEAKVITREELKQFIGRPCWFESHRTYMGKEGFWIIPSMLKTFSFGTIISYVSVLIKNSGYVMAGTGELGLSAYSKAWRCWSSKPTDEQRKAVKWE